MVDDGVATGATVRASLRAIRKLEPEKLILAVPVAAPDTLAALRDEADELVCLFAPHYLRAIGEFYLDFMPTSDDEVLALLHDARALPEEPAEALPTLRSGAIDRKVRVGAQDEQLDGNLHVPEGATGLVLFAHGSGSSRHSPRNRFVAQALREAGLGTLLFDLLTSAEEAEDRWTGLLRFDIGLLARRLIGATDWVAREEALKELSIGYFGASTGAAAALVAAAKRPEIVRAVVSRGGRPHLAKRSLAQVRAPTLFIVGGADVEVLTLNEAACARIPGPRELAVVPGATHLFEEPGALEEVARLAAQWFTRHLKPAALRATG